MFFKFQSENKRLTQVRDGMQLFSSNRNNKLVAVKMAFANEDFLGGYANKNNEKRVCLNFRSARAGTQKRNKSTSGDSNVRHLIRTNTRFVLSERI